MDYLRRVLGTPEPSHSITEIGFQCENCYMYYKTRDYTTTFVYRDGIAVTFQQSMTSWGGWGLNRTSRPLYVEQKYEIIQLKQNTAKNTCTCCRSLGLARHKILTSDVTTAKKQRPLREAAVVFSQSVSNHQETSTSFVYSRHMNIRSHDVFSSIFALRHKIAEKNAPCVVCNFRSHQSWALNWSARPQEPSLSEINSK